MEQQRTFWASFIRLVVAIFGRWQPPSWMLSTGRRVVARKRLAVGLVVLLGVLGTGAFYGYRYYKNRPKPKEPLKVAVEAHAPGLTPIKKDAKPQPLRVEFETSVAPLTVINKSITEGIELEPKLEGRWRWVTEKKLTFTPKRDWPVGAKFQLRLAKKGLVTEHILLSKYQLEFETKSFVPRLSGRRFYKDPVNPDQKKIVATFSFTHPVNPASFEKHLSLVFVPTNRELPSRDLGFTVTYGKLKGQAHVHSAQIEVPRKDAFVTLKLKKGVLSARGGPASEIELNGKVRVPGLYNFFRITNAESRTVENKRMEPEHVLGIRTSVGVTDKELRKAFRAWLLPRFHPTQKKRKRAFRWSDPERVSADILKKAKRLKVHQLPAAKEYDTFHSFRYNAPAERYIYLQVKKGALAHGGYLLGATHQDIVRVPQFPKQVKLMHSGAVLSLAGDKRVSVFARDVPGLRFEIARFLPNQLHHFISQSSGRFAHPSFPYSVDTEHLADHKVEARAVSAPPGKPIYEALDLKPYLSSNQGHRGLFLIRVRGWDPKRKRGVGPSDRRLFLVTDLGVLVKRAKDGTRMVFVQSLANGRPVAGARVEVLGKNGLAVAKATTTGQGSALLPDLSGLRGAQQPTIFVVRKGRDWSFLPWAQRDRRLDISRFDVGGVAEAAGGDELTAYLFSDRGIYRPGENFKIGFIIRRQNWAATYDGLPMVATIIDPRGLEIKRLPLKLDASGFGELSYQTKAVSPTGKYTVKLSTARDGIPQSHLGSTKVTVREFLPDRMRIRAVIEGKRREGWLHPKGLTAKITLTNLYGTPATAKPVRAKLRLTPGLPPLPRFRDYHFFDPLKPKGAVEDRREDETTDENGEVKLELGLERYHQATYRLALIAEGFEGEGGRSVTTEAHAVVSPLSFLIGYKSDGSLRYINRGQPRAVKFIAVGPDGKRRSVENLATALIERKVISVLTRQSDGTYGYRSVRKEVELSRKAFKIGAKGSRYRLSTRRAGEYALVIRDAKGLELQRVAYSVAANANVAGKIEKSSQLQLRLKSASVLPGGVLELQIKAPYAGAGLITIERDRVYAHKWFKTDTTSTVQTIRLPKNLEIGGYVSVAMIRSQKSDEVFVSPLTHGVKPFFIDRENRKITLEIDSPSKVRPGRTLKVKLRANKSGRAVLMAIDEGILRVAKHRLPDPLTFFLQKRALGVRTLQLLDLILPEHRQLLASLAPGGGDEAALIGANLNPFKRKADKPAVFWSGLVDVGPEARTISYQVPDSFNGTLRLMAVAASAVAVGSAEKKTLVRGDFVITPSTPMVVAPGDVFEVPVTVANNVEASGKQARVSVKLEVSKHLKVVGEARQELRIDALREASTRFKVEATDSLGSATLTFKTALGKKRARRSIDLSVRPAAPYLVSLRAGYIKAGKAQKVSLARKLYPHHRELSTGLAAVPLGLAHGLKAYLDAFPHGCTEQVVSRTVPAVILGKHADFGLSAKATHQAVSRFIDTVWLRQNSEGGFGKWVANVRADKLATVYTMQLLTEAKARGFAVPRPLLKKGIRYLQRLAKGTPDNLFGRRLRAWAIYLLTRNQQVTTPYLKAAEKNLKANNAKRWKKDLAAAYLAASYAMLKDRRAAAALMAKQEIGLNREANYAQYYDGLVHDGQLLYLMARHFPQLAAGITDKQIGPVVTAISGGRYNTFSSAWAILGLEAYAKLAGGKTKGTAVKGAAIFGLGQGAPTKLGGGQQSPYRVEELIGGARRPLKLSSTMMPMANFSGKATALRFSNQGKFGAYFMISQKGFDRGASTKGLAQGIEVFREYLGADGKVTNQVKVGDELQVRLRIRAKTSHQANIAIVDLLPGGFEVVVQSKAQSSDDGDDDSDGDEGGDEGEGDEGEGDEGEASFSLPIALEESTYQPSYGDVREDRVVLYGSAGKEVGTFIYAIKATNVGKFGVAPIQASSLYDRKVVARGKGGTITVIPR